MSRAIPLFLGMVYSIIIFILYTEGLNTYSCFIISDVIEVKKVGSNLVFLPSPPSFSYTQSLRRNIATR